MRHLRQKALGKLIYEEVSATYFALLIHTRVPGYNHFNIVKDTVVSLEFCRIAFIFHTCKIDRSSI